MTNRMPLGGIWTPPKFIPKPLSAISSAVSTISTITLTEEANNIAHSEHSSSGKVSDEVRTHSAGII